MTYEIDPLGRRNPEIHAQIEERYRVNRGNSGPDDAKDAHGGIWWTTTRFRAHLRPIPPAQPCGHTTRRERPAAGPVWSRMEE